MDLTMELPTEVIFIPADEVEAAIYLSRLTEAQPKFTMILELAVLRDRSARSKLRYLVEIGACEEMNAAENGAFEQEIARYELEIQRGTA